MSALYDVCGIGNALVDVVVRVDEAILSCNELDKGAMSLVDCEKIGEITRQCAEPESTCSGGSAANTMAVLAALGAKVAYIGKVHNDELGQFFLSDMERAGVKMVLGPVGECPPTGHCLVLVSPDAERTMLTYLGASTTLEPAEIDRDAISSSAVLYLEGYLYDPPDARRAMEKAAEFALDAGRKVAFGLSDSFCVSRHLEDFRRLVREKVDVVFGNAGEIKALAGVDSLHRAIEVVGKWCPVVVATNGAAGVELLAGGVRTTIAAEPVENVVDTTGAGDSFTAGFLYGLAKDWEASRSARLGNLVAARIVSQIGARPTRPLGDLVAKV